MSNLFSKHFQTLKKLYKYFLKIKLTLKYIGVSEAHIILEILLNDNIYLNIYNNSDWNRNKNNHHFIINYFFKITNRVISWVS